MSKKYYIYKFVDKEEHVLYVGKSKNLEQRISDHLRNKDWIKEGFKIYIANTISQTDMDIYELYYINKLKPIYNVANAYNIEFSINLADLDFSLYKIINQDDIPKPKEEEKTFKTNTIDYGDYEEEEGFDNQIGYVLNKHVYKRFDKYLGDLDFLKGYEFEYSDCGHESLRFTFLFENDKEVIIRINGDCGDLFFASDELYYSTIKNTLIEIFNNGIIKDLVPCQLTIDKSNNVSLIIYREEYNWYNTYVLRKGE